MSNKLYFSDSYKTEFSTEISGLHSDENGVYALLTDSYFYPESGGQPSDTGMINHSKVLFVKESKGEVRHYYSGELSVGPAECSINWERRFDYTQQHTGQHIISAVFYDFLKGETSSFTIGEENSTIEISITEFNEALALEVMKKSNAVVSKNLPIHIALYKGDDLAALPLRKRPSVTENIRIVSIENFDYSPCGGTHCKTTSEVGTIRISGWEKLKNSYKIYFVCGNRNIGDCLNNDLLLKKCASLLSAPVEELPMSIERIQHDLKDSLKETDNLRKKLSFFEASALFSEVSIKSENSQPRILMGFSEKSFEDLRLLGQELSKLGCPLAVLYLDDPLVPAEGQLKVVLTVSERVNENAGKFAKALFEKYGGRGGGGPKAAQGSVLRKFMPEFLEEASNLEFML